MSDVTSIGIHEKQVQNESLYCSVTGAITIEPSKVVPKNSVPVGKFPEVFSEPKRFQKETFRIFMAHQSINQNKILHYDVTIDSSIYWTII